MFIHNLLSPEKLHIPDGFLSTPVAIVGWVLAVAAIGYALAQTREQLGEKQIPLMGVMAAFIFAAQAINFPVAGGSSGHMLGGALAAIVLGPWAGVLAMTAVIALQALLFQDGGLLAMGWNIMNMGVLTVFTGALAYSLIKSWMGVHRRSLIVAGAAGAWLSVEVGAIATAMELVLSGASPLGVALPAMFGVHALIGIGEALITVGALALLVQTRPDLLQAAEEAPGAASANWIVVGLITALVVAVFSFAASGAPDGLERVAKDVGFVDMAQTPAYEILPDYTIPIIRNEVVSGILAVVIGTLVVFGITYIVGRIVRRKSAISQQ